MEKRKIFVILRRFVLRIEVRMCQFSTNYSQWSAENVRMTVLFEIYERLSTVTYPLDFQYFILYTNTHART